MAITYTSRINLFKVVATHVGLDKAVEQLSLLRRESDIMEIIGHPKNPNNAAIQDIASDMFKTFYQQLTCLERQIMAEVETLADKNTSTEVGRICFSAQNEENKLDVLTSYLDEHAVKASYGMRF